MSTPFLYALNTIFFGLDEKIVQFLAMDVLECFNMNLLGVARVWASSKMRVETFFMLLFFFSSESMLLLARWSDDIVAIAGRHWMRLE